MNVLMDSVLRDTRTVTPSLILDFNTIRQTYDRFLTAMPGSTVFYAVKANANPQVLQLVVDKGAGLE
ncbi:MAG: type III PLP-dependent enzyme, partial [Anaerolineae bacterium]|nr:type III PLP-dependent enzyme [Anaerolineae bacterium]